MTVAEFHYVTLIDAPAEKVWRALTTAEFTKQYWHGTMVHSSWEVGARVEFLMSEGQVGCEGEVLACEPFSFLSYSWHFPLNPACTSEKPSRVTFELVEKDGATKLSIRHDGFTSPDSSTFQMVSGGWPYVLAGLKTLCEAGQTRDFSALHG